VSRSFGDRQGSDQSRMWPVAYVFLSGHGDHEETSVRALGSSV